LGAVSESGQKVPQQLTLLWIENVKAGTSVLEPESALPIGRAPGEL
jgi:hypothetical protein